MEKCFELTFSFVVHEKIELLNEKLERDVFDNKDSVDYDTNLSKILTKKCNK